MFLLKNNGILNIAIDKKPKIAKMGLYLAMIKLALKIVFLDLKK